MANSRISGSWRRTLHLILGFALVVCAACFDEAEVFAGLSCESDEWCGPLTCIGGVCGSTGSQAACSIEVPSGMACIPAGSFISLAFPRFRGHLSYAASAALRAA